MNFPNKEFLESFEFHEKFYGYDDVRVFSIANITREKIDFVLQTECRKSRPPVWLYSRICNNKVVIDDVQSRTENCGNATVLFLDFLRCIIAINAQYSISKLCGFLSSFDFDHWDKLIHFYGKMNNHIILQPDLPITLDFKLRDYTVDYLLANMSEHKNENIDFDIFINYH